MNSKFSACVGNYVQIIRLQCCVSCQGTIQLCCSCLAWGRGLWVKLGEGCGCTAGGWVVGTAWGGVVAWPKYHTHIHTCTHIHLCTHAHTHAHTHTHTHAHTHTHVCTRTHALKLLPYYSGLNHLHKCFLLYYNGFWPCTRAALHLQL